MENQLNGVRCYTSVPLIMRKILTVWTEKPNGTLFDTMVCLRSSTSSKIHTTYYTANSCVEYNWQMHPKWRQVSDNAAYHYSFSSSGWLDYENLYVWEEARTTMDTSESVRKFGLRKKSDSSIRCIWTNANADN